jgi:hypothetical protein
MDTLKTLANNTPVVYVLIGTYELLNLTNLSAQLSRRTLDLHFARYRADDKQDYDQFESIVYSLQQNLPLHTPPDLVSHLEQCYEITAGCIGLLKDWLTNALAETLLSGKESLSWQTLSDYAPEERKRYTIALEINEGEQRLAESAEGTKQNEIRRLVGLPLISTTTESTAPITNNFTKISLSSKKKTSRRVGERKPIRDKVGRVALGVTQ